MGNNTNAVRISATIPAHLAAYLEQYQRTHKLQTRSQALTEAVLALRELELRLGYEELGRAQRNGEVTYPSFDATDGLDLEDAGKWR
jgi:metal-responsive CopG/Arc/MetJ family transcriptional regulator